MDASLAQISMSLVNSCRHSASSLRVQGCVFFLASSSPPQLWISYLEVRLLRFEHRPLGHFFQRVALDLSELARMVTQSCKQCSSRGIQALLCVEREWEAIEDSNVLCAFLHFPQTAWMQSPSRISWTQSPSKISYDRHIFAQMKMEIFSNSCCHSLHPPNRHRVTCVSPF